MPGIQGNIFRLYVIKTAKWFSLVMPVIVLFYKDNGLNMQQIFWLKSIYSIGVVVMEIPSGYFADVWGRKKTLVLGSILTAVGYFIYAATGNFLGFLFAEIALGVGQSFISGADSALLYDSLKELDAEKKYLRLEGRITSYGNFAEAIAGVIGGWLAALSLRYPFIGQAFIAALAIPASLTLVEPSYARKEGKPGVHDILDVVHLALFRRKDLRTAILFSALIGTSTLTFAWFVQPFFEASRLPIGFFGIMWTALNLTVGIVSMFAYKVEEKLGQKHTMFFILVFIGGAYLVVSQWISLWAFSVLFFFYMVRGVATPVLKNYINRIADSETRATVLSVRNFVIRIIFALIGPLLGWTTDQFSLGNALLFAGLFFLSVGGIVLGPFLRENKRNGLTPDKNNGSRGM